MWNMLVTIVTLVVAVLTTATTVSMVKLSNHKKWVGKILWNSSCFLIELVIVKLITIRRVALSTKNEILVIAKFFCLSVFTS